MGVGVPMLLVHPCSVRSHCVAVSEGRSLDVSGYSLILPFDSVHD